ncbi:phosphatase PAP2 family protein [Cellvibrio sp. UBA7661]|uniref:phosphatase PAP2 family protein n=1 Tax=Cellvibrio sp. UBA7661 TaxID=1946311 RepID=UPI002F3554E8
MKLSLVAAVVLIIAGAALFFLPALNQSLFIYINSLFPHQLFWTAITTIGEGSVAGCIFYLLLRKNNDALLKGAIAAVAGLIVANGFKYLFAVPRPEHTASFDQPFHLLVEPMSVTSFSMPSGHTIAAFLLGTLLFHFLKLNLLGKIALGILLAAIGISRIALGVHWPADVLAGAGLGIFVASVSAGLPIHINNKKGIRVVHLLYLLFVVALVHKYVV